MANPRSEVSNDSLALIDRRVDIRFHVPPGTSPVGQSLLLKNDRFVEGTNRQEWALVHPKIDFSQF